MKRPSIPTTLFLYFFFALILIFSFLRIHSRIQITLLGYEIGRMKEREADLIKVRSLLTMELAKITTKEHLQEIVANDLKKNEKQLNQKSAFANK
ncbi:MAG: hypothetical protein AB8G05_06470 [Oligoflexales bacterium]